MLGLAPALTLLLFLAPVAAGLIGTWLPAFGYLPALGGQELTLAPWRALFASPGLSSAIRLTLTTGLFATTLSLMLALGLCMSLHGSRPFRLMRRLIPPLLATPHAAFALGLVFLIGPSGWIVRALSPWATGWTRPPDLLIVQDPWGMALVAGLVLKEVPYLILMILAALNQLKAEQTLAVARSLGYGPIAAWLKAVLPGLYPQIRLPIYAVLTFSFSVVDMAIILAPNTPPPLAVEVVSWFNDRDLAMTFQAAAGATLLLALVLGAIFLWVVAERLVASLSRPWLSAGSRGGSGRGARIAAFGLAVVLLGVSLVNLLGMALWSFASLWRFPHALPAGLSLAAWANALPGLLRPGWTTLAVGIAASVLALVLVLACLENEERKRLRPGMGVLWLLYAPLLLPQAAFLFGAQVLLVLIGLDASLPAVVWFHLFFVLPYVFLSLSDPWRTLDERYQRTALCLGAAPFKVFWRIKLPMLLRPVLFALAVGFAVSVAQYLPTLFAGGGRWPSLTTEAVTLSAGGDRRLIGVYAFSQSLLPLLGFTLAMMLPVWVFRHRRALARVE
ncbi:MAG: ABC transporter permease [Proteobacteria bacterium]|nr:ABC transporter permease [Pseudomonadota bacterium]MBI3498393.1 ABC transporter permease [Pseudomonadota bacterium]